MNTLQSIFIAKIGSGLEWNGHRDWGQFYSWLSLEKPLKFSEFQIPQLWRKGKNCHFPSLPSNSPVKILKENGCEYALGLYISKPLLPLVSNMHSCFLSLMRKWGCWDGAGLKPHQRRTLTKSDFHAAWPGSSSCPNFFIYHTFKLSRKMESPPVHQRWL